MNTIYTNRNQAYTNRNQAYTNRKRRTVNKTVLICSGLAILSGIIMTSACAAHSTANACIDAHAGVGRQIKYQVIHEGHTYYPEIEPEETAPRYALSDEDRDIVERVVMAEAEGESFDGQKLVAQCILTACEKTGLTPSEVVVKYGYATLRPEPSLMVKTAVADVFDRGELVTEEPVMYFYNPFIVFSRWHETQIFVIEEGGHRFFAERTPE